MGSDIMLLDSHIHIGKGQKDRDDFERKLKLAGVNGGVLLSQSPASFGNKEEASSPQERLENLFYWTGDNPNLYPFYWIDPMEKDALEQVSLANQYGVKGFKVICSRFNPGESKAMEVYKAIAKLGKPMLFHSGILWDGIPSSMNNHPSGFEPLLEVDGLKFALAHVSWPWCDECIAVYGKFLNAYSQRPDLSVEMFIDITPGTPPIYRREVLTKIFTVGYDIENNILFGTDCNVNNYNYEWAKQWIDRDNGIYSEIGLADEIHKKIYSENLKRFLGISTEKVKKRALLTGV